MSVDFVISEARTLDDVNEADIAVSKDGVVLKDRYGNAAEVLAGLAAGPQREPIGWCLCLAKNVSEDDPFWVGWIPVTKREGKKLWFLRPRIANRPKRDPNNAGYHFKLIADSFVAGAEPPAEVTASFRWPK